jgi:hypothetical protein
MVFSIPGGDRSMIDEDPSPQDLERFGRDTAYCPLCGAEIWDQAELCPSCGGHVGGETTGRPPLEAWLRRRWLLLVVVAALVAFVIAVVL